MQVPYTVHMEDNCGDSKYRKMIFNNQIFFSSDCPQIHTCAVFLDLEQELADYNGDDENEGEFEADKQAELAQI